MVTVTASIISAFYVRKDHLQPNKLPPVRDVAKEYQVSANPAELGKRNTEKLQV